jgi:hypothetical protein
LRLKEGGGEGWRIGNGLFQVPQSLSPPSTSPAQPRSGNYASSMRHAIPFRHRMVAWRQTREVSGTAPAHPSHPPIPFSVLRRPAGDRSVCLLPAGGSPAIKKQTVSSESKRPNRCIRPEINGRPTRTANAGPGLSGNIYYRDECTSQSRISNFCYTTYLYS